MRGGTCEASGSLLRTRIKSGFQDEYLQLPFWLESGGWLPLRHKPLLTGQSVRWEKRLMTTIYISSAIISVLPRYRDEVLRTLTTLHNVEVRHANASKIIIIIESVASGILGARLAKIASRQGVLSAKHGVRARREARRDRRLKHITLATPITEGPSAGCGGRSSRYNDSRRCTASGGRHRRSS